MAADGAHARRGRLRRRRLDARARRTSSRRCSRSSAAGSRRPAHRRHRLRHGRRPRRLGRGALRRRALPARRPPPSPGPPTADPRLAVRILPGLRQDTPADVMRGEETQIAGLLAARARLRRRRLPARHPHQVGARQRRRGGQLRELHDRRDLRAARRPSRCCARPSAPTAGPSADFLEAVEDGLARPERVAARLFGLRAEALLHGLAPERARARLSGLLIGAELAGARALLARPRRGADRRRRASPTPTATRWRSPASPPASPTPPR